MLAFHVPGFKFAVPTAVMTGIDVFNWYAGGSPLPCKFDRLKSAGST